MEEKERYEWNSPYDSAVRDNKNDDIINAIERLNEQDKRIKELEQENQQLKQQLETFAHRISDQNEEILELKQQLHDLPKKIVEDIQENFDWKQCCEIRKYYGQQYTWFNYVAFNDFLDTILKKYGGNDE